MMVPLTLRTPPSSVRISITRCSTRPPGAFLSPVPTAARSANWNMASPDLRRRCWPRLGASSHLCSPCTRAGLGEMLKHDSETILSQPTSCSRPSVWAESRPSREIWTRTRCPAVYGLYATVRALTPQTWSREWQSTQGRAGGDGAVATTVMLPRLFRTSQNRPSGWPGSPRHHSLDAMYGDYYVQI